MKFNLLTFVLAALLCLMHYQFWLGEGRLSELQKLKLELDEINAENSIKQAEVERLQLTVETLRGDRGFDAMDSEVESFARKELGMLRKNEIFVSIKD